MNFYKLILVFLTLFNIFQVPPNPFKKKRKGRKKGRKEEVGIGWPSLHFERPWLWSKRNRVGSADLGGPQLHHQPSWDLEHIPPWAFPCSGLRWGDGLQVFVVASRGSDFWWFWWTLWRSDVFKVRASLSRSSRKRKKKLKLFFTALLWRPL